MKKKTLISTLREKMKEKMKDEKLELVSGGCRTMTQDENGTVIVVDGDSPCQW